MKKRAHQCFSLGFLSICAGVIGVHLTVRLILAPLFFFTGLLNDFLDFHLLKFHKHRNKISHAFVSIVPLALYLAAFLLIAPINPWLGFQAGVLLALGYFTHLCLDALNPSGVYLWGGRKIKGTIRYNHLLWNAFFIVLGVVLFIVSLMLP